jgi:hypothetical protein
VGENFDPIEFDKPAPQDCSEQGDGVFDPFQRECLPTPGHLRNAAELKRIALFHYATRSWEDFLLKMERGDGVVGKKLGKKEDFFWFVNGCAPVLGCPLDCCPTCHAMRALQKMRACNLRVCEC